LAEVTALPLMSELATPPFLIYLLPTLLAASDAA